ncbi:Ribonuclease HII [Diplonema papillatum]|nr:Ribonuclease HII [Diplonema papillatum]
MKRKAGDGIGRERELEIAAKRRRALTVVGVDEAGRGPLAGPVVVAACALPKDFDGAGIDDSKKIMRASVREALFERLTTAAGVRLAVSVVSPRHVDGRNILAATLDGMRRCCQSFVASKPIEHCALPTCTTASDDEDESDGEVRACYTSFSPNASASKRPKKKAEQFYALFDGNRVPTDLPFEGEAIVKGDGKELCIAAASIVAKVTRDRLMTALHRRYPSYRFDQHKGYPTAWHREYIKENGVCPHHRRSYAPVKEALSRTTALKLVVKKQPRPPQRGARRAEPPKKTGKVKTAAEKAKAAKQATTKAAKEAEKRVAAAKKCKEDATKPVAKAAKQAEKRVASAASKKGAAKPAAKAGKGAKTRATAGAKKTASEEKQKAEDAKKKKKGKQPR